MSNLNPIQKFLRRFLHKKWMKHPAHLVLCSAVFLVVGLSLSTLVGVLSVDDKKAVYESVQLSSTAKNLREIHDAEFEIINRLSVEHGMRKNSGSLPKRFKNNPAFRFFVYIGEK